ncbi:MAG TPA: HipA N-terminal domain-containing protein [Luteibacter sp.]|uniref:HipA N-terminal domain-containing protein n=1 Tax=Luteibacter sp. TaxID=1886636 RepID=UPI002C337643|nr:HipA N-terminal domain-containing protein [Luteibacter sp.]HVI56633.1 HipA N-terminal domain-containing protein [Luteibacter sp.]
MPDIANLELYVGGVWRDAASVRLLGPAEGGWEVGTDLAYGLAYAVDHESRNDAAALSVNLPVSLESTRGASWPPFLTDLLPQGFGRQELLRRLGMPETAAASADWRLLLAGAANPIGNIRVREAAERLMDHAANDRRGFTEDEVVGRNGEFTEHLARHGLFVAASSDDGAPRWASVIQQTVDATGVEEAAMRRALVDMVEPLRTLRDRAIDIGVDVEIMDMQRPTIEDIVVQLEAL